MTIAIPNKIAKKITCNMLELSPDAEIILVGTISTTNCRGPESLTLPAAAIFLSAPD